MYNFFKIILITCVSSFLAIQASANDIRQQWLDNPQPDIPREVTDEDLANVRDEGFNKVMNYLRSPKMEDAFENCKTLEVRRFSKLVQNYKEQASKQTLKANKDKMLQTANAIDAAKEKMSPTTCFFRTYRLALLTLQLPYYGTQRMMSADESSNVVHFYRIGNAFQNNEFSEAFDESIRNQLLVDYDEWLEIYVLEVMKENSKKIGAGKAYESAFPIKVQRYNNLINAYAGWFINGVWS